jgi:hypothetical protein
VGFRTLAKNWMMVGGAVASFVVFTYGSISSAALQAELARPLNNCEKKAVLHLQENLNQVAMLAGSGESANLAIVDMREKGTSRNLTVYEVKVLRTNQYGEPVGCLAKLSEAGIESNRANAVEICAVSYKAWAAKSPRGDCSLDNIKTSDSSGIRELSIR